MDLIYSLIPIVFALLFGISPWLLVLVPLRNTKARAWWQRTGWIGSLMLALANLILKIGAGYFAFIIVHLLGYSERDTFNGIYHAVNFLDLGLSNGVLSLTQNLLSGGHVDSMASNVAMAVDFALVFGLFLLVWSVRARSDNQTQQG